MANQVVIIPKDVYDVLLGAAENEQGDIQSGIEDGVYEDDEHNARRLQELEMAINYKPIKTTTK